MQPKLRESSDTLRSVQILLLFFKFFGIIPISVHINTTDKSKNTKTLIFSYSKWGIVYSGVLICCFIASGVLTLPEIYSGSYLRKTILIEIVQVVIKTVALFSVCLVISICTARQKSALRISYKILYLNRSMVKYNFFTTKTPFSLYVATSLLHIALWVVVIISEEITFTYALRHWICYVLPMIVIYMFFIQYVVIVKSVTKQFKTVNRVLSSFATLAEMEVPTTLSQYVLGISPTVFQLRTLKNIHRLLCEICLELEKFYSLPIFLSISCYFLNLLYDSHNLVLSLYLSLNEGYSVLLTFNSIIWVIVDVTPLITLSFNITAIENEMKRTSQIVHKLLNRTSKVEAESELRQFSLQLLHHDVQFSAFRFFFIDLTIIHSIMSSTATYVIILFQLQP